VRVSSVGFPVHRITVVRKGLIATGLEVDERSGCQMRAIAEPLQGAFKEARVEGRVEQDNIKRSGVGASEKVGCVAADDLGRARAERCGIVMQSSNGRPIAFYQDD